MEFNPLHLQFCTKETKQTHGVALSIYINQFMSLILFGLTFLVVFDVCWQSGP